MGDIFKHKSATTRPLGGVQTLTLGTVIDLDDPQQMGRLRVLCPKWGDDPNATDMSLIPWAQYGMPSGGSLNSSRTRGPNEGNSVNGPVSYGLWTPPTEGATALVACVDGNPAVRVVICCIADQGTLNTLPHGRHHYKPTESGIRSENAPEGPYTSNNKPIEPLYGNQTTAFGSRSHNFEWRTRGSDYSASGNTPESAAYSPHVSKDEVMLAKPTTFQAEDGRIHQIVNGYTQTRNPKRTGLENSVWCWVSPGFHAISMDDRRENCRMKLRSSAGNQIILDDTNERMYMATANGSTWVEMDWDGNIDIFADTRVNIHSVKDLNLTSDAHVRIFGKEGVDLYTPGELRAYSGDDLSIKTDATLKQESQGNMLLESHAETHMKSAGNQIRTGAKIHDNGPTAKSANADVAKMTNRIPQHEPWARTTTKSDTDQSPKYDYNNPMVGREDRTRGPYWRR